MSKELHGKNSEKKETKRKIDWKALEVVHPHAAYPSPTIREKVGFVRKCQRECNRDRRDEAVQVWTIAEILSA